jgi:hypothetical protein
MVYKSHWWLYTDYYKSNTWPSPYGHEDPLGSLMSFEKNVMLTWLILGLVFLALTLVNSRWLCIIVGLTMVAAMALAVAVFAGNVAGAVNDSYGTGGLPYFPPLGSFFGSTEYGLGVLSWGPSSGWFFAFGACVMQAIVLLLVVTHVLSGRREPTLRS